jgi:hypothetical protein
MQLRLRKAVSAECHSLGYKKAAATAIADGVVEDMAAIATGYWTWVQVQEVILQRAEEFAASRRKPYIWVIREALVLPDEPQPMGPVADGDLVREVLTAMENESDLREWLTLAQPLLLSIRLGRPEFETAREMQLHELFYSGKGLMYMTPEGLVEVGEIGTDLLHDLHGRVVEDAEEIVRSEVVRLLLDRLERERSLSTEQHSAAVDAAHEIADQADVLRLWYRDIDQLVQKLEKNL